jgi:hypothetical protein
VHSGLFLVRTVRAWSSVRSISRLPGLPRCWYGFALLGSTTAFIVVQIVPDPPEAHSPVTLLAVSDRESGHVAFAFAGKEAPVLRAMPGESIRITYTNAMAPISTEKCATGPCMHMTNLHFHGLHVSPNAPQDDMLTMLAMPGGHSSTLYIFVTTSLRVCTGTTRIRMVRVTDRYWMGWQERWSSRASNVTCLRSGTCASGYWCSVTEPLPHTILRPHT